MAQALVDSAIEFCDASLVMRERLDGFTTTAGIALYDLAEPTQQTVSRVTGVTLDGIGLSGLVADHLPDLIAGSNRPVYFYTRRDDSEFQLGLYPPPDAAYQIRVSTTLRPARNATQLQNDLFDLWIEPIIAGAIARVCAVPNQPYSNPSMAQFYAQKAGHGATKARAEGAYGRMRGPMQVKPRPFA